MNKPKFYIYGVPDGFNMLSGTPEEILYYQLFYDTSKKGKEMRINRKANGETVYSYLIYNLVSCKGREGAFLGMSIVFSGNEYCNDPAALIELFEGIYNEVILKADDKGKIVIPIDGGNAIGRFCIPKFDERQDMCEKIGRIIVNNIIGELDKKIAIIDNSFDSSKEGRILTLPINADNKSIIQAFRSYTWVSISTEYKPTPVTPPSKDTHQTAKHTTTSIVPSEDLLSVHFTKELKNKVSSYKDFIISGLKGLATLSEITKKREEINHYLDTLEEYVGRQPELTDLKKDYISIYQDIIDLKPQRQADVLQHKPQLSPPSDKDKKDDWLMAFLSEISMRKVIGAAVAIFAIVLIIKLWPSSEGQEVIYNNPDQEKAIEEPEHGTDDASETFDEKVFNSLLDGADYKEAWSMIQNVQDDDKQQSLKLELQNSYRKWFNEELDKRQKDLQGLLNLKDKIAIYADFNIDNDRHNMLLDEDIASLKKLIAQQEERERQERIEKQKKEQQKRLNSGDENGDSGNRGVAKPGVIKIYQADANYTKGAAISASGNVIICKRKDCFVIEGATLSSKDSGIEAQPTGGIIRIRAANTGKYKVKLNQIEYTFNVTP